MPRPVNEAIIRTRSRLCVGLDPDPARLPAGADPSPEGMSEYLCRIIDATADLACAYKPNLAFFEAMGPEGDAALREVLGRVPEGALTIGDAKRGDIGNTSAMYARALFDDLGFDSTTVNPMMGYDCVEPFLEHKGRVSFLLCLTSNPGADDFLVPGDLYLRIAEKAGQWNEKYGNVGLVVGATRPEQVADIRAAAPSLPFLIPGIGAQGGEADEIVARGRDDEGEGLIFNVSRAVLYAGDTDANAADAARAAAERFAKGVNWLFGQ